MRCLHGWLASLLTFAALAPLALVGCTTISSSHVMKHPKGCGWKTKHLRGVPVTVKLPTQLEIRIVEKRYFSTKRQDFLREHGPKSCILTTRHVEYDIREKEEVFTVDMVRPAAGLGDFATSYDNQFFTKISGTVQDKTIEAITGALGKVTGALGGLPKSPSASNREGDGETFQEVPALLAVRVFDIHDTMLERNIQEFLHQYLNGCRTPGVQPGPRMPTPHCQPVYNPVMPSLSESTIPQAQEARLP